MTSIAILGATGNLGGHVARQVLDRGWTLSVAVRSRDRLSAQVADRARVTICDLSTVLADELARFVEDHDALVWCAGVVTQAHAFVALIDRIVAAVESVEAASRPVSWFMAGAALLDLDVNGRRGVDLPKVRDTYWPHRSNFERLGRSGLEWRLLCPGPMVDQPGLGVDCLRISIDGLPVPFPAMARVLPSALLLPLFAQKIPQMIIPYADAATVMLNNLSAHSPMSRKRVGIALPVGMRGKKTQWAARPNDPG
jgi:putative NADH-flavin reductase